MVFYHQNNVVSDNDIQQQHDLHNFFRTLHLYADDLAVIITASPWWSGYEFNYMEATD
jgi:hypothetical protein